MRDFVRAKMRNPRMEEIDRVLNAIESWGDERDAAYLEQLATEFPAMSDHLREKARMVREGRRAEAMADATPEELERLQREQEAAELERATRLAGENKPPEPTPEDG